MKKILLLLLAINAFVSCESNDGTSNVSPSRVQITIAEITDSSARVSWNAATDPEGSEVIYRFFLDGELLMTNPTGNIFNLNELSDDTTYVVTVEAEDADGYASSSSRTFTTLRVAAATSF